MAEAPHDLARIYTRGGLECTSEGLRLKLKNRVTPLTLMKIVDVRIDDVPIPRETFSVSFEDEPAMPLEAFPTNGTIQWPLGSDISLDAKVPPRPAGEHSIFIQLETKEFGLIRIKAKDELRSLTVGADHLPRNSLDDYADQIIAERRHLISQTTGVELRHVAQHSFDPRVTKGNIESFIGVAQIPLAFAGPLLVRGPDAQGEFFIPLATTEGTLVASYNRGMKLLRRSGGVHCTVVEDHMQRAPVFAFEDAAMASKFAAWVLEHEDDVRVVSGMTDRFVSLERIDCFLASRFAFLRFDFSTGDAAGQNIVGKATFAACNWILQNCREIEIEHFFLEANIATDKKPSMINVLRTRGKRVTAEATIRNSDLMSILNTDAESLHRFASIGSLGTMLSGANNNGCHSVNAITAMFIATGQDVANVAEASASLLYTEITKDGDLYISITIPSLIVGSVGGGTGLPTQRECLEVLGCYGSGKSKKLAAITAGTVLAGELSLAGAITALDWVSSHEKLGRNPPQERIEADVGSATNSVDTEHA